MITIEQFVNDFISVFPEKKKILDEHYKDYEELLAHLFFSDAINDYLFPLLQLNKDKYNIKRYCDFLEKMWLCDNSSIINVLDVTILERLSDDIVVWVNFGKYISKEFKQYINEEVLTQNIMMLQIQKL